MKLIIDIEKDYYEMLKYNVEHGQEYKPFEIIANGIPYNPTVELTETEVQEVLNKRCMTAVANEYLITLHGNRPQGEWIPTSEMLPGKYGCYIVMWRSLTEGYPDSLFYEICEYEPEEDEWERIEQAGKAGAEIVAWMHLPEPYKERGAEE